MKIAVTGAAGYLGELLLARLCADPEVQSILALDLAPPRFQSPRLAFARADVRSAPFAELLRGCDALYHLAFIVEPPKKMPMSEIDEINVGGSQRVFRGAAAAGVSKIIYASSCAAYGAHPDNPNPLTEEMPLRPNEDWYYSRAKGRVERDLDEFQREHPQTVVIRFRPSIFLGPTVRNSVGAIHRAPFVVCIDCAQKTDFCWDGDIVEAFALALRYDRSDVFNLTGGGPLTAHEVAAAIGKRVVHVSRKWAVRLARAATALRLRPAASAEWIEVGVSGPILISTDRARERLGWRPQFDSAAALRKYVGRTQP